MKLLAKDRAEVRIDGVIGGGFFDEDPVTAASFSKALRALGKVNELDIVINSPGGSVFDGNGIHSQLARHPAKKTVYIEGLAASIASVIAMVGDEIVMPENAMLMIHRVSGLAMGTAEDLRKTAETLEKVEATITAVYAARTGRDAADITEMMAEETWMTAAEAVALGFADRIAEPVTITACADPALLAHYRNCPATLIPAPPTTDLPLMEASMSDDTLPENPPPAAESAAVPESPAAPASESEPAPAVPGPDVSAVVAASASIADACARAGFPQLSAGLIARQASADEVTARLTMAATIKAACQLAKADDRLDGYLTAGLDEQAVRADLFNLLATRDQAAPVAHTAPDAPAGDVALANAPLADRCQAEWQRSPSLRAEFFDDFNRYLAYEQAMANRQVRLFQK